MFFSSMIWGPVPESKKAPGYYNDMVLQHSAGVFRCLRLRRDLAGHMSRIYSYTEHSVSTERPRPNLCVNQRFIAVSRRQLI